ncbi:MAG: c-type cytochrome [Nitrospinia bacterium]
MIFLTKNQKKISIICITWTLFSLSSRSQSMAIELETGRDIFYKYCKACHGDRGDGKTFAANVLNPPPKNFTTEASKKELTEQRMIRSITKGRKNTAMMPWQSRLTKEEIRAVVHYIRKKLMQIRN